jgi:hypothetical protein
VSTYDDTEFIIQNRPHLVFDIADNRRLHLRLDEHYGAVGWDFRSASSYRFWLDHNTSPRQLPPSN